MSHARVEELSDSDPDIDDPTDFLPESDNHIIRAVDVSATTQPRAQPSQTQQPQQSIPPNLYRAPPPPGFRSAADVEKQREAIKHYCTVYPCYFASSRTRSQGRRVSKALAIENPLAFNVLKAVSEVVEPDKNRIHVAFEPDKTHPKDWSNPGRVRIHLFDKETHESLHPTIKNKEHLFVEVAKYMGKHPTQKQDPLEMKLVGLPIPDKFLETEIPKPRGWEIMNGILPVHSPAVSGGGVRDDFFKEAMEELRQVQGAGGAGAGGPGGPGGMPDMASLQSMMGGMGGMDIQSMMNSLGGMGGMGLPNMPGLGGGESSGGGKKKKDKKKG